MINELIQRVKNNDYSAFDELVEEMQPIIRKILSVQMNEYGDFSMDKEEMKQIAIIGLYEACQKYKDDKGMSFSSFSYMVIHSRITNYFKENAKVYDYEFYSLDVEHNNMFRKAERVADSAYNYHKQQEFEKELLEFLKSVTEEDRKIISLKREGLPYKEIGKRLNISTKRISNRLQALKKKYAEYKKK